MSSAYHRSSMKSLKELGLAGMKRSIQLGRLLLSTKSQQVHLKRYLSIIKPVYQRTLGSWTLQKHLHWRHKEDLLFAGFVKKSEKKERKKEHFAVSPQFPLSFSSPTKTKGDFSRSLYQHYLTSSSGFDQITDQIPQDEYWKFVMISTLTPNAVSQSMASCLFSQFLYFSPYGQKHCCYKNKNSEIPSLTKFGNSLHTWKKSLFLLGKLAKENWQLSFSHIGTYINWGIGFKWFF